MTNTSALRPAWTPLTIFLMVVGFIAWWPLGLAMLAYILWGDRFHRMVGDARAQYRTCCGPIFSRGSDEAPRATGNAAFDEYRAREIRRLEEERRKLDRMREEFDEYLRNLRRARDQEEFDRFMRERAAATGGTESEGGAGSPSNARSAVPFTVNTYAGRPQGSPA